MSEVRKSYSFIGNDCPPGYRWVGTIDVADPADVHSAQDRGYRIGTIYDGYSGSCAEPCAADIYERPDEEPYPPPAENVAGVSNPVLWTDSTLHMHSEAITDSLDAVGLKRRTDLLLSIKRSLNEFTGYEHSADDVHDFIRRISEEALFIATYEAVPPVPSVAMERAETGAGVSERPICAPLMRSDTDPTWMQVVKLFQKHGMPEPPFKLRDELVIALEWAWFGYEGAK